ncbi:MAG: CoA-binding protein [Micrococcaceae bacterium]
MKKYQDEQIIKKLLTNKGAIWAIVGLSNKPERTAYKIAQILRDKLGMKIVPVNPRAEDALGEKAYASLAEIPEKIDVVDCFVNSSLVGNIVDQAIKVQAKAVWLQLGVIDEAAAKRADKAGLDVVMDTCPAIEMKKL